MTDNIHKLIRSNVPEDVAIGLKLLIDSNNFLTEESLEAYIIKLNPIINHFEFYYDKFNVVFYGELEPDVFSYDTKPEGIIKCIKL